MGRKRKRKAVSARKSKTREASSAVESDIADKYPSDNPLVIYVKMDSKDNLVPLMDSLDVNAFVGASDEKERDEAAFSEFIQSLYMTAVGNAEESVEETPPRAPETASERMLMPIVDGSPVLESTKGPAGNYDIDRAAVGTIAETQESEGSSQDNSDVLSLSREKSVPLEEAEGKNAAVSTEEQQVHIPSTPPEKGVDDLDEEKNMFRVPSTPPTRRPPRYGSDISQLLSSCEQTRSNAEKLKNVIAEREENGADEFMMDNSDSNKDVEVADTFDPAVPAVPTVPTVPAGVDAPTTDENSVSSGSREGVESKRVSLAKKRSGISGTWRRMAENSSRKKQKIKFKTASGSVREVGKALRSEVVQRSMQIGPTESEEFASKSEASADIFGSFGGFKTASGSNIKVQEESMLRAKRMIESIDMEMGASGAADVGGDNAVTPTKHTSTEQKRAMVAPAGNFGGFQTASGKNVVISPAAMAKARKLVTEAQQGDPAEFADPQAEADVYPTSNIPAVPPGGGGGFQTGSGKAVKISKEALEKGRKLVESVEPVPAEFGGFQTGAGKKVEVGDEAMEKARKLIADVERTTGATVEGVPRVTSPAKSASAARVVTPAVTPRAKAKVAAVRTPKRIASAERGGRKRKFTSPFKMPRIDVSVKIRKEKRTSPLRVGKEEAATVSPERKDAAPQQAAPWLDMLLGDDAVFTMGRIATGGVRTVDEALACGVELSVAMLNFRLAADFEFEMVSKAGHSKMNADQRTRKAIPVEYEPYAHRCDECAAGKTVGWKTVRQWMLLCNCMERFCTEKWARNQYQHVVWKLASVERRAAGGDHRFKVEAGVGERPAGKSDHICGYHRVLTPFSVFKRMIRKYRFEIGEGKRSALNKICCRDELASRSMVLVVCEVDGQKLVLSDGWYAISALLDPELANYAAQRKIATGMKLRVMNATLVGGEQANHPLDVTSSTVLKLSVNSVHIARRDCILGFTKFRMYPTHLESIRASGGIVSCVDVLVARMYPLKYMVKTGDVSTVLDEKEYLRKEALAEIRMDEIRSMVAEKRAKGGEENVQVDPEDFNTTLSQSQMDILETERHGASSQALARLNEEMEQEIMTRTIEDEQASVNATPFLTMKIMDTISRREATITLWRPSQELIAVIKEGNRFLIYGVIPSSKQESAGLMSLSTTRHTFWNQKEMVNKHVEELQKRSIVPLARLHKLEENTEFDAIAYVLHVGGGSDSHDATRFLFLSDNTGEILALLLRNSYVRSEEGQILVLRNILLTKFDERMQWHTAEFKNVSHISTNISGPCSDVLRVRQNQISLFLRNNRELITSLRESVVKLIS